MFGLLFGVVKITLIVAVVAVVGGFIWRTVSGFLSRD